VISDWSDFQTVLAIARKGSLSGAARELGLSQSTVSRRLQGIERRLNRQVFVRDSGGDLSLNETGKALVAAAERMDAAFRSSAEALSGVEAPVRVATCEVVAKAFLVSTLSAWTTQTGGAADLSVHDDLFHLPDDAFDVLVTPLESAPENMVGHRVVTLNWGVYASPRYIRECGFSPGQSNLSGYRVIRSSGSLAGVAACAWFEALGGQPVFSASSPAAQMEAAAAGTGFALLPEAIAMDDPRLVRVDVDDTPTSQVWMVARRAVQEQPRVAAFLKWSRQHFSVRRGNGHSRTADAGD